MKIDFVSDTEYIVSELYIQDFTNRQYCIFDFEATGINHEVEYITQIGAVYYEDNSIQTSKSFNSFVKPPKLIPEAVERFTGIYNSNIQDAPVLRDIHQDFINFTK